MINMGMQGQVKEKDKVCALHLYINMLNVEMAKPLLMGLYKSHPSLDHVFPLHVCMQFVPEIDSILNIKGQKM